MKENSLEAGVNPETFENTEPFYFQTITVICIFKYAVLENLFLLSNFTQNADF